MPATSDQDAVSKTPEKRSKTPEKRSKTPEKRRAEEEEEEEELVRNLYQSSHSSVPSLLSRSSNRTSACFKPPGY